MKFIRVERESVESFLVWIKRKSSEKWVISSHSTHLVLYSFPFCMRNTRPFQHHMPSIESNSTGGSCVDPSIVTNTHVLLYPIISCLLDLKTWDEVNEVYLSLLGWPFWPSNLAGFVGFLNPTPLWFLFIADFFICFWLLGFGLLPVTILFLFGTPQLLKCFYYYFTHLFQFW